MLLPQLRRIRWAVRATLLLGVAASVLANILHALDNPISQAIAAWPPVALLLTVELISRVPVHRRLLAATRLIATATIAGIAAWVSYWHMAGVAARYGETGASPYLLPLSVDGLIVVASICLVELGGRIASLEQPATAPVTQAAAASPTAVPAAAASPTAVPAAAASPTAMPAAAASGSVPGHEASHIMVDALPEEPADAGVPDPGLIRAAAARTGANPIVAAKPARVGQDRSGGVEMPSPLRRSSAAAPAQTALPRSTTGLTPTATRSAGNAQHLGRSPVGASGNHRPAPTQRQNRSSGTNSSATRARRSPAETVAAAARIKAERPTITEAELAAELGISPSRWRTVRREAADRDLAA
ncbi:DUF2637 domain-containing protein [Actinoplanes sp. NPDC051343]|uniref:DUF2637 domain-containing protein n=1 Tax=Actinoplanes sp. NPDC051343 TaxID=3363906 RepID=UPI0037B9C139